MKVRIQYRHIFFFFITDVTGLCNDEHKKRLMFLQSISLELYYKLTRFPFFLECVDMGSSWRKHFCCTSDFIVLINQHGLIEVKYVNCEIKQLNFKTFTNARCLHPEG